MAGALCALVMMAPAYKGFPRWAASVTPLAVALVAVVADFRDTYTALGRCPADDPLEP